MLPKSKSIHDNHSISSSGNAFILKLSILLILPLLVSLVPIRQPQIHHPRNTHHQQYPVVTLVARVRHLQVFLCRFRQSQVRHFHWDHPLPRVQACLMVHDLLVALSHWNLNSDRFVKCRIVRVDLYWQTDYWKRLLLHLRVQLTVRPVK